MAATTSHPSIEVAGAAGSMLWRPSPWPLRHSIAIQPDAGDVKENGHIRGKQVARIICLGAALTLVSFGLSASSALAATAPAVPGFADGAAQAGTLVAGKQVDFLYDATRATAEAADGVPSCASIASGAKVAGTLWMKVPAAKSSRAARPNRLTAALRADRGTITIVAYGAVPQAGAEMSCMKATTTSGVVRLDLILQRKVDVWIMVAGLEAGGPATGVGQIALVESKVQALDPAAARRDSAAAIGIGRYLVAFGGMQTSYLPNVPSGFHSDAVDRLDIKTGKWTTLGRMPAGLSHGAAFQTPAGIHLAGGRANPVNGAQCIVNTHYILDPAKGSWSAGTPIPGASRFDYAAVSDPKRGRAFVIGGAFDPTPCDFGSNANDEQRLAEVWSYEDRAGWRQFPNLAVARQGAAATLANDVMVVAGGLTGAGAVTGVVEAFDARQNRWVRLADLPVPVYGALAVPGRAANGTTTLVVAGGWNATARGPVGVLQVLNFKTGRWTIDQRGTMTPREALYGGVVRGQLVAAGGVSTQQVVRLTERFTVDRHAPKLAVRRSKLKSGGVRLRASVSDLDSGIVSVTWKLAGVRKARTGTRLDAPASAVGRKVTVTVVDGAGNATRRTLRI